MGLFSLPQAVYATEVHQGQSGGHLHQLRRSEKEEKLMLKIAFDVEKTPEGFVVVVVDRETGHALTASGPSLGIVEGLNACFAGLEGRLSSGEPGQ